MECRDVRDIADSFLAEELLTETNHEILRHLATCPVCRDDLAARRALRERMRRAIHNSRDLEPRPEFIAELRTTLQHTARDVPTRRGLRFPGWLMLAATVLLAVAVGAAYRGRDWLTATSALARAAVGDHRNCALHFRLTEKPIELEQAARRFDAAYRVLETLPPSDIVTAVGPARVLERHACVYNGRRFAHVVIEFRGESVSLLVTAAEGGAPIAFPGDARPHVTAASRIDDMSVVSFRTPRHMVFLAGDVARLDLVSLAEAVSERLYGALAAA